MKFFGQVIGYFSNVKFSRNIRVILILGSLLALPVASGSSKATSWPNKVDAELLAQAADEPVEFLVFLGEQADLSDAASLQSKSEKGAYIYERLRATARRSQAPLIAELQTRGWTFRPYWIANFIWVRGDSAAIQFLAQRAEVDHIYANPTVRIGVPEPVPLTLQKPDSPTQIEWNISKVNAPQVWAAGVTGRGAVVAGQDTGYKWDHPALINQYRGWDGAAADHNYNWHDAIHIGSSTGNPCGYDSQAPCDDYGHGTHTMGTMVGDDGQGNQIGMAPEARWIGCRNMDRGVGTPATYSECFQWFMAPTDLNGQNPRPDLAPDVVNNSWSCPSSEGCSWDALQQVIENVRAAGILVVTSAGNNAGCATINEPPALYEASFAVGATDIFDQIASFSSRGPVTIDGSNRLKPDVSAPGVGVRSSIPAGYSTMSGTSMAAPHVAGLAALMISANPPIKGQVSVIEDLIKQSALPLTSAQDCGGVPGSQVPNNTFGYGRIDACTALQASSPRFFIQKTTDTPTVAPGGQITYMITVASFYPSTTKEITVSETLPANAELISADPTPEISGDTLLWKIPPLDSCANQSVVFTVKISGQAHGTVDNLNYSVSSEDHPIPLTGAQVTTPIMVKWFLPLVARQ